MRRALGRTTNPRFRPSAATGRKGRKSRRAPEGRERLWLRSSAFAWLLLLPWGWLHLGLRPATLLERRAWSRAGELSARAWPPDLSGALAEGLAMDAVLTLAMSVLGIGLASGIALALAIPAARNLASGDWAGPGRRRDGRWRLIYGLARAGLLLLRTVPAPIWALLALFLLFPGILPGGVALGLYTAGIVGRLSAEVMENLPTGAARALASAGAPSTAALLYGMAPAAMPRFTAYALYRWEECIRASAIVGVVGAGGLGRLLEQQRSAFDFDRMAATLLVFVLLTVLVDQLSGAIRRSLR